MVSLFELLSFKSQVEIEIKKLKSGVAPIIIYGAGLYSKWMFMFLKYHHIPVSCFVVDDEFINKYQVEVKSWSEVDKMYEEYYIVNAIPFADNSIINSLVKNNDRILELFFFDVMFFPYFKIMDQRYIKTHHNEFLATFNLFEDDLSRRTYIGFLNSKLSFSPQYLEPNDSVHYFPSDIIAVSDREIFVDCGAYIGDTLSDFHSITDGKYVKYYGFEPDRSSFKSLEKSVTRYNNSNILLINKGVSNKTAVLKFSSDLSTDSHLSKDGDTEIQVDSIDKCCSDATFIKMDIEGGEYDALLGAKTTIKSNHPTLAISIYHRPEHLFKIPLLINSFTSNYKYYVRQHSPLSGELVLYAIP
jgi:FkbM family methyltransferase